MDLPYSRTAIATAQVSIASLQLMVVMLFMQPRVCWPTTASAGAMLALGALGSGIAYIWNYQVIQQSSATVASTVTYWTPLVAVFALMVAA